MLIDVVIDRKQWELDDRKRPSVRTRALLMGALLRELHTEKIEIEIDELCVFTCSQDLFKLAASSRACFVEHLTTLFRGFTTHSQFCVLGTFFDVSIVLSA